MTSFALLFALAAIGVSETAYLIQKRFSLQKPVCPIGDECSIVLESKYNKLFLIPNDVLGIIFYIVVSFIAAFLVIGVEPISFFWVILKIAVGLASLMSLVLVYLQWQVIKAWCFWCLMSAFTIWLMGLIILIG